MGDTKASNGVSANKNRPAKSATVKEVSAKEIDRKIQEFGDIYVGFIDFEVNRERIVEENNSTGTSDTEGTKNNKDSYVRVDNAVAKSLETVIGPGILVKVNSKKRAKAENRRDGEDKNEEKDSQEIGE